MCCSGSEGAEPLRRDALLESGCTASEEVCCEADAISLSCLDRGAALASPLDVSAQRIGRLREACKKEGLDAFFVRDLSNIRWLTAFDNVFDDEDAHALLISGSKAVLHTDSRYSDAARRAASGKLRSECASFCDEAPNEGSEADARPSAESKPASPRAALDANPAGIESKPGLSGPVVAVDDTRCTHAIFAFDSLGEKAEGEASLGIESSMMLGEFRMLEAARAESSILVQFRETSGFVRSLRAVKDRAEIERLKAAQRITDAGFSHIVGFMRPGMTEREVQIELEDFMRRRGAEDLAFPSIVAAGVNGASPHAIPGSTRLEAGQCVVLDFGARLGGYCSDMTRTVFLGEPSSTMREAYAAIRQANEQVEAKLKPGVTGAAMHALAEEILSEAGFEGKMGHALGHGVGIDIHEEPGLSPRYTQPLVEGNVLTVEPGVYLSGEFGMRLEDFGIITHDGFEVFTESTHDPVII